VSGSVTEMPDHQLAGRDRREPLLLLRFGAALEERLRQDLRPRDERARAASDAHESSSVMTIIARLPMPCPPYCSGTDMPK
jgi:hypothetical protein